MKKINKHLVKDAFEQIDHLKKVRSLVKGIVYAYDRDTVTWWGCNGDTEKFTTIKNKMDSVVKSCVKEVDAYIASYQKIIDDAN